MHSDPLALAKPRIAAGRDRIGAGIIDSFLLGGGPIAALLWFTSANWDTLIGIATLWSLFLFFAFESGAGQTPGKRVAGLRVVKADGTHAGMGAVALRTLLRLVDALPSAYLIGMVTMLIGGERRQRLGDIAAGTVVSVAAPDGGVEMVSPGLASPELLGAATKRKRPRRDLVVAGVLGVFALLLMAAIVLPRLAGGPEGAVKERVLAFADARAAGDGKRACEQLTPDAQRDVVGLVTKINVEKVDPADCATAVLKNSDRATFTSAPASAFQDGDRLQIRRYVGDAARVFTADAPGAELGAMKVGDEWLLDGLGPIRGSFIAGCAKSGQTKAFCGCVFEAFRDSGEAGVTDLRPAMERLAATGRPSADLAQAVQTCSAASA